MSAYGLPKSAYGSVASPVRTDRDLEFDAFASVTHRLVQATVGSVPYATFAAALHENRRLWTFVAGSIAEPENGLPANLRAQLFYLAECSLLHTRKVLKDEADASLLIDINRAVMRGLRSGAAPR